MICKSICALLAVLFVMLALPLDARSCNIGVTNGTVTQDGRPLLWKVRMTSGDPDNRIFYKSGPQYNYIGIAGSVEPWMGVNSAGLCTGNSYVGSGGGNASRNRDIIKHILGNFSTVAEVRNYLAQPGSTTNVKGCYPFMDAAGNATVFEINHTNWVYEYDTTNPNRTAQIPFGNVSLLGQVTRANEYHQRTDGADDLSIGGRYYSGSYNTCGPMDSGLLSVRTVVQGNNGTNGYEFMRYGPDRPLSTIATWSVVSSMVVHGVGPAEDPALATMWALLGQSNYSVAVPTWVRVSDVPTHLANGDLAARANSLYGKNNETNTQASTLPFEACLFDEVDELLGHWRLAGTPSVEEMTRVEHRMANDAYSLMNCLDNTRYDNLAPTAALSATPADLTLDFEVTAADIDGGIDTYDWNFGDDKTSPDQLPSHTYDAPGWYLVSCTVTDDDGVSATDWQYFDVVPEPAILSLLAFGAVGLLRRRRK